MFGRTMANASWIEYRAPSYVRSVAIGSNYEQIAGIQLEPCIFFLIQRHILQFAEVDAATYYIGDAQDRVAFGL